jgi:O-antigen ligase
VSPPPASAISAAAYARTLDRDALARVGVGALAGGAVGALAAAEGGSFPVAWGWAALVAAWIAALALLVRRRIVLGRLELALIGSLTALLGWVALSALWTPTLEGTVNEIERDLVYVTATIAFLTVVRRSAVPQVIGGLLTAISLVCTYALATRLFPDRLAVRHDLGDHRLSEPLGYWNALGLFAVMGLFLALGVVAFGRRTAARAAAGTAVVVLAPVLYFTFSRGALLALLLALVVWIAFTPQRLRLIVAALAIAPAPAVALAIAATSSGLTRRRVHLAEATSAGHRMAWIVLALLPVAALATAAYCRLEGRVRVPPRTRLALIGTGALAAVAAIAVVFSLYGGPATLARRGYDAFKAPLVYDRDLNQRLLRLSNTGRITQWRVAWRQYEAHPWLGSGAGSFEQNWFAQRPSRSLPVRDADNLYIEVLAELGPLGLGLILAVFGLPIAAAVRARKEQYVSPALAVLVAYLIHAAYDWDWEMPALTFMALFAAGVILVQARRGAARAVSYRIRYPLLAVVVACTGFAIVSFIANNAMNASGAALSRGQWDRAVSQARKAAGWAPWSAEAWRLRAEAYHRAHDDIAAGAAYQQAIQRNPGNWQLWYEYAFVAQGRGRELALARARELNPNLELRGD